MKKEIVLDEAAQELFAALGGIDTSSAAKGTPGDQGDLSATLGQEDRRMDEWRIALIEFLFRLGGHLKGLRLTGINEQRVSERDDLFRYLSRLIQMPDRGSKILLRFRGMGFGTVGRRGHESDYVVTYGPLTLDIPIVKAVVNRRGVSASHLPGRLSSAFELFSSMQINTLHISLREWNETTQKRMDLSFQGLAHYFVGFSRSSRLTHGAQTQETESPGVVLDQHQRPDPSLTMLAYVNGLSVETVQSLANKVALMLLQADAESPLNQHANIYEAIFAFKNLREKLMRSPIEVNNVRWLIADRDDEVITREKAAVGRLVMEKFSDSPKRAAQLIESIYGTDFPDLAADALDARLGRVTDFLDEIEPDGKNQMVEEEVLGQVHDRLEQVPEEIFDSLGMKDSTAEAPLEKTAAGGGKLHHKLLGMVSFFKRRFGTKKKIRQMMHKPVEFDDLDYETIAEDFGITLEDARKLVKLLKSCFDGQGHFLRPAFEKNIPAFAKHENKVFEFLWYYLKEIKGREDRVAFLNSIQSLISQMKRKKEAMRIILNDLIKVPETVSFSDRNALMLANLLIRKYNKELRMDIEISPEEVLRVRDGLDMEIINNIHALLDEKREPFIGKLQSIHRKTKEMLNGKDGGSPIPVRYLLSLERECYIFVSLVGGGIAHRIMYGAAKEYGDPTAEIYHLTRSGRAIKGLIQILRVTLRGLARFGASEDKILLKEVKSSEPEFMALTKDDSVRYSIANLMKWISNLVA